MERLKKKPIKANVPLFGEVITALERDLRIGSLHCYIKLLHLFLLSKLKHGT